MVPKADTRGTRLNLVLRWLEARLDPSRLELGSGFGSGFGSRPSHDGPCEHTHTNTHTHTHTAHALYHVPRLGLSCRSLSSTHLLAFLRRAYRSTLHRMPHTAQKQLQLQLQPQQLLLQLQPQQLLLLLLIRSAPARAAAALPWFATGCGPHPLERFWAEGGCKDMRRPAVVGAR